MSAALTALGRVAAGEIDTYHVPRNPRKGKRGVVLVHGFGGGVPPQFAGGGVYASALAAGIVDAGIPCMSAEMADNAFANDTHMARITSAWSVLQGLSGCASDKVLLLGISMGGFATIRYASANPSTVAGALLILSGTAMLDGYNTNSGGFQAAIGTAWGVTYPTPLPAGADLLAECPAMLGRVPSVVYYSTVDTTITPNHVTEYAAASGAQAIVCDATFGHSDLSIGEVPIPAVIRFLIANGA